MKIAFFSDVHANIAALNAVLNDIDAQKPDAVYCLGDLVGYHIYPNEVIAAIRARHISTIKGNHDKKVVGLITTAVAIAEGGSKYAYHIVNADNRHYLNTLPAHIKLEYRLSNSILNIVLAHGSTRKIDEYVLVDTDENYLLEMMEEANADLLFVGHSHKPFYRILNAGNEVYKRVINIGSVGKPKDGDPRACYVMLTLNENSSRADLDSIRVEFRRVDYDIETAARALENSPLPVELADRLRKAY